MCDCVKQLVIRSDVLNVVEQMSKVNEGADSHACLTL